MITSYTPEDLLVAERHIAEAEQRVVDQEEVLTKLRSQDASTALAEQLLSEFQEALKLFRIDRDNIAAALARAGQP